MKFILSNNDKPKDWNPKRNRFTTPLGNYHQENPLPRKIKRPVKR